MNPQTDNQRDNQQASQILPTASRLWAELTKLRESYDGLHKLWTNQITTILDLQHKTASQGREINLLKEALQTCCSESEALRQELTSVREDACEQTERNLRRKTYIGQILTQNSALVDALESKDREIEAQGNDINELREDVDLVADAYELVTRKSHLRGDAIDRALAILSRAQ